MKKNILIGVIAFVLGIVIASTAIIVVAPGAMLLEDESKYEFDETVEVLTASIESHGWKLPAVHDLQKTMIKFGYDVKKVQIFELCHPEHAARILEADEERIVSSLMPCRIAIYEREDGKVYISRLNSSLMSSLMGGLIKDVMTTAAEQNEEILEAILN
ncbi:MAG: DUF302 domain-containing protein [Clostridiales bacterium]|nr:DUF302 domain-containing protein [Clostridiales bacterium]